MSWVKCSCKSTRESSSFKLQKVHPWNSHILGPDRDRSEREFWWGLPVPTYSSSVWKVTIKGNWQGYFAQSPSLEVYTCALEIMKMVGILGPVRVTWLNPALQPNLLAGGLSLCFLLSRICNAASLCSTSPLYTFHTAFCALSLPLFPYRNVYSMQMVW